MSLLRAEGLAWQPHDAAPRVLDDLDLDVVAGDRVAIRGPSGCGKSTLLRCLVALEPWAAGRVVHRGTPVGPATVRALRRDVAWVAQQPVAVGHTVADDLGVAATLAGVGPDVGATWLARVGLDVPGDRPVDRLSVGERQRLCLARTLVRSPSVLLLDEPTAALDAASTRQVEDVVAAWLDADADRAAVWVTHDDAQARRVATRPLHLVDGRLA